MEYLNKNWVRDVEEATKLASAESYNESFTQKTVPEASKQLLSWVVPRACNV